MLGNHSIASGLGVQSMLHDLGIHIDICVFTDATGGKAMASRRGLGKVHHIAPNEPWIQENSQNKTITIYSVKMALFIVKITICRFTLLRAYSVTSLFKGGGKRDKTHGPHDQWFCSR